MVSDLGLESYDIRAYFPFASLSLDERAQRVESILTYFNLLFEENVIWKSKWKGLCINLREGELSLNREKLLSLVTKSQNRDELSKEYIAELGSLVSLRATLVPKTKVEILMNIGANSSLSRKISMRSVVSMHIVPGTDLHRKHLLFPRLDGLFREALGAVEVVLE